MANTTSTFIGVECKVLQSHEVTDKDSVKTESSQMAWSFQLYVSHKSTKYMACFPRGDGVILRPPKQLYKE